MKPLADRGAFPILERTTYLVSHSLGAMPQRAAEDLRGYTDTWASRGVRAWAEGWWDSPIETGNLVGKIIDAPEGTVAMHQNVSVIQGLVAGDEVDYKGTPLTIPWAGEGSHLPMWGAGYGPKALTLVGRRCDGFILQLADPYLVEWTTRFVKDAASAAGRDPDDVKVCVAAPAYVGDDIAHQRDQVRWFGGMVGNHVADLVGRYGSDESMVPKALSDYIAAREGYDYDHHGKAGNPSTDFVPDEVVDRFCVLGPVETHIARMEELRDVGVDQFSIYLMHDDQEGTLDAYGEAVIPALGG